MQIIGSSMLPDKKTSMKHEVLSLVIWVVVYFQNQINSFYTESCKLEMGWDSNKKGTQGKFEPVQTEKIIQSCKSI
jgi:hypothetical protein